MVRTSPLNLGEGRGLEITVCKELQTYDTIPNPLV